MIKRLKKIYYKNEFKKYTENNKLSLKNLK